MVCYEQMTKSGSNILHTILMHMTLSSLCFTFGAQMTLSNLLQVEAACWLEGQTRYKAKRAGTAPDSLLSPQLLWLA